MTCVDDCAEHRLAAANLADVAIDDLARGGSCRAAASRADGTAVGADASMASTTSDGQGDAADENQG